MRRRKTLRDEIRSFRKTKVLAAPPLIAAGLVGLVLPVLPGWPLLATAFSLVVPQKLPLAKKDVAGKAETFQPFAASYERQQKEEG